MAQTLVNLGSIHGKFNVREAIPHRTTISKKVPEKVQEVKTMVRAALSNKKYVGLTTDGWTDDMLKVSYITTTVHYFDEDMNLHSSILDTSRIDDRKTAEVIGKQLDDVAAEYGLTMSQITVVTDNASNMLAACRGRCCRLSCFAHCLNLVVTDMLDNANPDLQALVSNCKTLVRHFKHAALQSKLKKTLKQECPTRWNSLYTMMESIASQYDDVHDILAERKELRFLYAIDKNLLTAIVDFLEHFKVVSETVCSDSKPTLHLVVPYMHRLTKLCEESNGDPDVISLLKAKACNLLNVKVRLDPMHDLAAFLNPCMKGLTFLSGIHSFQTMKNELYFVVAIILESKTLH
jgi:hypothetical protein